MIVVAPESTTLPSRTSFLSCTGERLWVERVANLQPHVRAWVDEVRARSGTQTTGLASVRDGQCALIEADHTVVVFSASDPEVAVWTDGSPSERYIDHMLRNHVVPRRLSLRGERILHATAVALDGVAVAFVGASMAGKSTLAAAFAAGGAQVLADDTLRLQLEGDRTVVLPTSSTSRLREDSAAALLMATAGAPHRSNSTSDAPFVDRRPVPLGLICLVERGTPGLGLAPVGPSNALVALARSAFLPEALEIDPTTALDLFLPVLEQTRVATLSYPDGFAILPGVVELIVRSMNAQPADSPSTCLKGGIHANTQDLREADC